MKAWKSALFTLASFTVAAVIITSVSGETPVSGTVQNAGERELLSVLWPHLEDVGAAARIYYAASCSTGFEPFTIPAVRIRAPAPQATGLTAIRQMFSQDRDVSIGRDGSGIVRIFIGSVHVSLLRTKIRSLMLEQSERYVSSSALAAIQESHEVQAAAARLRMQLPPEARAYIGIFPSRFEASQPHLSSPLIQNMTMDQAADVVARTFHGVVEYDECQRPNGGGYFALRFIARPQNY